MNRSRSWVVLAAALGWIPTACGNGGTGPSQDDPGEGPVPCLAAVSGCWQEVPLDQGFRLPVYRTHPVTTGDTSVVQAVIVVHGTNRNADDYFETMVTAVSLEGATDNTLVISPRFQTSDDNPQPNQPYWTSAGWKRGNQSHPHSGTGATLSSYEAMDELLAYLLEDELFPKLESVVVTGHSAGGQYVHRFAATSPVEAGGGVRFRYVVANPSTYLYLGPERADESGGFSVPDRQACPDYNEWHYGLEDRNPYALRLSEEATADRLLSRDVYYLVGSEDTGTNLLDMTCGAMLQGQNRYLRGLTLFGYLEAVYPSHVHHLSAVPGVGHSSAGIYQSTTGRRALFEW